MFNKTQFTLAKITAALGFVILFYFFTIAPVYAAPAVEVWWPAQNAEMQGTQPFKGILQGTTELGTYKMYWQVDGGNLVEMGDSYADYPHKEASVDLTNWNWKGTGPYVLTFVAKDQNGNIVSKTDRTIYTGPKVTAVAAPVVAITAPVVKAPNTSPSQAVVAGKITATVVSPTPTPTPVSAAVAAPAPVVSSSNPLSGKALYVDPNSQAAAAVKSSSGSTATLLNKIAQSPTAVWLGNWYDENGTKAKVASVMSGAKAQNSAATFVLYNIPQRDCGSYSAGGANNPEGYRSWINTIANTIGNDAAVIILEPDALPQSNCLNSTDYATRMKLLTDAITTLKSKPNIAVYLDAGHSGWKSVDEMSDLLNKAGISKANGFSLNVSNYSPTASEVNYGKQISAKVGNKHFVIDTSRNGNGSNGEWCNPSGRALGEKPSTATGESLVDAYLWIKAPGESDGQCNGGPSAGTWWNSYALGLATLSRW